VTKFPYFVVAILFISAFSVAFVVPTAAATTQSRRLGFWLQEGDITRGPWAGGYSPTTFFNTMFLTPPYPSSVEVMLFAILQAKTNNQGCDTGGGFIGNSLNYWGTVSQLADSYPNIRLVFEIAFDAANGGSGPYGLDCFNSVVQSLARYSSVYGLGVEGEYTYPETGLMLQSAMNDVTAAGRQFINYYSNAAIPSGSFNIAHTNFPGGDGGGYDQVSTLRKADSQTVGLDSGYYASFPFPGAMTCPIAAVAVTALTAGFNQCVISTELSTALSLSTSQRQFLELDPGFSSSGYFTGASGQSTNQLWDNPTLRNWIWNDPNYLPNFIQSTSSSPVRSSSTTSLSTTAVSSTTITSSTSAASTATGVPNLSVAPTNVPYNPLNKQTLTYGIAGGPPGLTYSIRVRNPSGSVQVLSTGTDDASGSASGTLSDVFDVSNGIFDVMGAFANGASTNMVGIQVGPSSTTSTTTYVAPVASSTLTTVSSTSSAANTATSQHVTTKVTTTLTTTSRQTSISSTTNKLNIGGKDSTLGDGGSSSVVTSAQSSMAVSSGSGREKVGENHGSPSAIGTDPAYALVISAGVALGLVVLAVLRKGTGNLTLQSSGSSR
jgi:hypothetical protein